MHTSFHFADDVSIMTWPSVPARHAGWENVDAREEGGDDADG